MSQTHTNKNMFSIKHIVIALIVLLVAFFAWWSYMENAKKSGPVQISISESDHSIGNKDSKVHIIEYADFQCPYCASYDPVVSQFLAKNNDKVYYTFKHFPLISIHQNTMTAAIGSEAAARQGKFWEYKKVVFENQKDWESSLEAEDKIASYLPAIGIDVNKWKEDMKDPKLQDIVMNSYKEAMSIGISGTPSIIINGERVDLNQVSTLEDLQKYVDNELAK
ncbi:MAG: hypothetical protein QG614_268 [Patescibacteria group bacterium]|nr:hypothetical protein [Patescibacteria group bacterium]